MLDEYRDHLPLTARQIFYRLVGAHGYDKTDRAYDRLTEHLGMARRAGIIPLDAIRDDGVTTDALFGFHGLWRDPRTSSPSLPPTTAATASTASP